jgi:hypothetical protein
VTWTEGGLRYAAIADIDGSELGEFALLVRTPRPLECARFGWRVMVKTQFAAMIAP